MTLLIISFLTIALIALIAIFPEVLWRGDIYTEKYPPLRIAWNLITFPTLFVSVVIATFFVGLHSGPRNAVDFWKGVF